MKCKTCHGKSEEKGEFGSPKSESLCFKGGTSIMLGPNTKILKVLFLVPKPSFVVESLFHLHTLVRPTTTLKAGWLVKWPDKICILCCIYFYLPCMDLLRLSFITFNGFPLMPGSHNSLMLQTRSKREEMHYKKLYFRPLVNWLPLAKWPLGENIVYFNGFFFSPFPRWLFFTLS
jgi:hypothetical protein